MKWWYAKIWFYNLMMTDLLKSTHQDESHNSFETPGFVQCWRNHTLRSTSGEFHEELRYTSRVHTWLHGWSLLDTTIEIFVLNHCCKLTVEPTFRLCNGFSCRVSLAINFCHRADTTVTLWQTRYSINL